VNGSFVKMGPALDDALRLSIMTGGITRPTHIAYRQGENQIMLQRMPKCIETERLYLRPYQEADASWFYGMSQRNRTHLSRYEAQNIVMSVRREEDAPQVIQEMISAWDARDAFFIGAFDRETNAFVAQVYVGPVNWELPAFEIGYFVDVDHEGRGYVTEAVKATLDALFGDLKAHRIRLECDDTNGRSRRVAERCGFVLEGHIRENRRNADGTLSGTLHFGLLRREFERASESALTD
jgi:aminoglycoside 6'-N-acetyltransferase